jgi:hypothetical protein
MSHDKPEDQVIRFIKREEIAQAERVIESCERCDAEASIPFDSILDHITGSDPARTGYLLLEGPATCPGCREDIVQKTRVKPVVWVPPRWR